MSRLYETTDNLYHLSDFGFRGKVKKIINEKSTYEFSKKGLLTSYSYFEDKNAEYPYRKVNYEYDKNGDIKNRKIYNKGSLIKIEEYTNNKLFLNR